MVRNSALAINSSLAIGTFRLKARQSEASTLLQG